MLDRVHHSTSHQDGADAEGSDTHPFHQHSHRTVSRHRVTCLCLTS